MARFTSNFEEIKRLSKLNNNGFLTKSLIQVKLLDGSIFEGANRGASVGNNAGECGSWLYYGEITIQNIDGSKYIIDLLEVDCILDIWKSHHQQYHEAGVIQIINDFKS